jgi:protein ECT2
MEEMRNLIGRRQEETPRGRTRTAIFTAPSRTSSETSEEVSRTIDMLVADADQNLVKAQSNQDVLQNELRRLASEFKEVLQTFLAVLLLLIDDT